MNNASSNDELQRILDGNDQMIDLMLKSVLFPFLVADSKTDLQHFLHFLTSLYRIPPLGLETHLTITYKEDTSKTFHAETCAYNLNVPTVHDTYEEFQHYFLLTCRVGYVGFGLV